MSAEQPVCSSASCGARIWWNPRKLRWQHYFEPGDHEAAPE